MSAPEQSVHTRPAAGRRQTVRMQSGWRAPLLLPTRLRPPLRRACPSGRRLLSSFSHTTEMVSLLESINCIGVKTSRT